MLKSAVLLLTFAPMSAFATSVELPYQGRLTDVTGAPVNGSHTVTVRLYDSLDAVVFSEPFTNVEFDGGYFTVRLGADPANFDLQHTVVGTAVSVGLEVDSDGELTPRSPLSSVPFATTALEADHATTADTATTASHATTADSATTASNATTVSGLSPSQFAAPGTLTVTYTNCAWTACVDGGSSTSVCPANKVMRGMDVATHPDQKPVGCTATNHEDEYRSYCCEAQVTLVPAN